MSTSRFASMISTPNMNTAMLLPLLFFATPMLTASAAEPSIDVCFSPGGGCTQRIVTEIDQAKTTLRVQSHALNSPEIAKAIRQAHKRGVECVVILDRSQEHDEVSKAKYLIDRDILVLFDDQHPATRSNIILIDGTTIITGSMDLTRQAERKEANVVLFIENHLVLAGRFNENFAAHKGHSRKYEEPSSIWEGGREQPVRQHPGEAGEEQPPATTKEQPKEITVYVTKSGTKYHRSSCSYLRKSRIPMPLSQAAGRYSPCSRCKSPTQ